MDKDKRNTYALHVALVGRVEPILLHKMGYPKERECVRVLGYIAEFLQSVDTKELIEQQLQDAAHVIDTMLEYGNDLSKASETYIQVLDSYLGTKVLDNPHMHYIYDALDVRNHLLRTTHEQTVGS